MRTQLILIIVFLILFSNVCILSIKTEAQTDLLTDTTAVRDSLRTTFLKLQDAEKRGANITSAAQKLDRALQLIDQVKNNQNDSDGTLLSQATSLIDEVDSSIPSLTKDGENRMLWNNVALVSTIAFLVILCLFVYLYLPNLMWSLWTRSRSDWKVKTV